MKPNISERVCKENNNFFTLEKMPLAKHGHQLSPNVPTDFTLVQSHQYCSMELLSGDHI